MNIYVFDAEADGLVPTKFHCMVYQKLMDSYRMTNGPSRDVVDYGAIRHVLGSADVLIGHNIIRWDIPHIERLAGKCVRGMQVDTLALSWYLEPDRPRHGLASYAEELGLVKPVVEDWETEDLEVYLARCHADVAINTKLWIKQYRHLMELYEYSTEAVWAFIEYLMFKMRCAKKQEDIGWKVDLDRCSRGLQELTRLKLDKTKVLAEAMPKVPVMGVKTPPAKPYKKNGELSVHGANWQAFLKEKKLPVDYDQPVGYIKELSEPNPNSSQQLKHWCYSLGWKPTTYKYVRDKETNEVRKIEQLSKDGEICPSVQKLCEKNPELSVLSGLSIISHRIGMLDGFIRNLDEFGWVKAEVQGLTNTLRFKHKVCVNLPGIDKPYGKLIRGCLIAQEGEELCGSDMVSLEDRTKQHYMWDWNPEYVEEMTQEGFDPHLDVCITAGLLTEDQVEEHKRGLVDYSKERKMGKAVNYAAVYGVRAPTLARTTGLTEAEAQVLLDAYWRRNWAVTRVANSCRVKRVKGKTWLYNEVSGFWYHLRYEKDRFSTLNQGTGVFAFDTWVKHASKTLPITAQFHDEVVVSVAKGKRGMIEAVLRNAMGNTNKELGLNVNLCIDVQFGKTYADIH